MLWKGTDTAGLNQSMLSSIHHPSPWPVTKAFRPSVQEQDKLIADTPLFICLSSQPMQCWQALSGGWPCSAVYPTCLPAVLSGQEQVSSRSAPQSERDIVQEQLHRNLKQPDPARLWTQSTYSWGGTSSSELCFAAWNTEYKARHFIWQEKLRLKRGPKQNCTSKLAKITAWFLKSVFCHWFSWVTRPKIHLFFYSDTELCPSWTLSHAALIL